MAAAKEFNIGKDTLVDFLVAKGFDKDELKPTAKLSEDMYRALQAEFQSDKVAKMKSTQIDLPKGATADAKKKKDEEEISFHKGEKKRVKKEEPAPAPLVEGDAPAIGVLIGASAAMMKAGEREDDVRGDVAVHAEELAHDGRTVRP